MGMGTGVRGGRTLLTVEELTGDGGTDYGAGRRVGNYGKVARNVGMLARMVGGGIFK